MPTDLNRINAARLQSRLTTRIYGRTRIEIHEEIDSTNARATELAREGAEDGTVVLAETQTAGRGRLGRAWHSPPGLNIYLSIVLRLDLSTSQTPVLTLAAGLAAAEAIGAVVGLEPSVKWPNDLLIGDRKIAGLLAESEFRDGRIPFVIFGIGVNVNLDESHLPQDLTQKAGSIKIVTGREWDREALLAELLLRLENRFDQLKREGSQGLMADYRRVCVTIGRRVTVTQGKIQQAGRAVGVDDDGRLAVRVDSTGETIHVDSGEVTLSPEGH